jgi:hypothetical protein
MLKNVLDSKGMEVTVEAEEAVILVLFQELIYYNFQFVDPSTVDPTEHRTGLGKSKCRKCGLPIKK